MRNDVIHGFVKFGWLIFEGVFSITLATISWYLSMNSIHVNFTKIQFLRFKKKEKLLVKDKLSVVSILLKILFL